MAAATLLGCIVGAGCGAEDPSNELSAETSWGDVEEPLAACAGDDPQYDFNALTASLAVAIANELGRWDVITDFQIVSGKLQLSKTGQMRCAAGCPNVNALLQLQDDVTASVPNHSPSIYRGKLASWYQQQNTLLNQLVNQMLTVDKGIYRLKAHHDGKYIAVSGGSTLDGALVVQQGTTAYAGADQWRMVLSGTKHKFINVRSGKCLALNYDTDADGNDLVQRTCSTSTTQDFEFGQYWDYYAIRTKYYRALGVSGNSTYDNAHIVQINWDGPNLAQQWTLEPYGTGAHVDPKIVATAVYTLTSKSGQTLGVQNGSLADNANIVQSAYVASDDGFKWYITQVGSSYQFVNRRSGKCMALATDAATSGLVQRTCANSQTQLFSFAPTGADGYQVMYSKYGRALEIAPTYYYWDVPRLVQGADSGWSDQRMFRMTPILAGEPHKLSFASTGTGAQCGVYYWYNIAQPNGDPLRAPADSWVQLIFAGGKQSATGTDVNPFIAQQVNGNQVAIDPTYGLDDMGTASSGACAAACVKISTTNAAGQCCSCNGVSKAFAKSAWNAATFLCQ